MLDQGCLPGARRNDDRGVDPLADRSLYGLEHSPSQALLRCAADRPRRCGAIACLGGRHARPPDRRDPRSRGVPLWDGTSIHDEYREAAQIFLFHPEWLSRWAGRVGAGVSGGWPLFREGGRGPAPGECLHHGGLVPVGYPGWNPVGAARPLVDQPDAGDDRPPAQADSALVVAAIGLRNETRADGGADPPSLNPQPFWKEVQYERQIGMPSGRSLPFF